MELSISVVTERDDTGLRISDMYAPLLRLQYLPLRQHTLQQRLHAQFLGDGQRLVLEVGGLLAVARPIEIQQHLGVVVAGPGEFWAVAGVAAEGEGVVEVGVGVIGLFQDYGQPSA